MYITAGASPVDHLCWLGMVYQRKLAMMLLEKELFQASRSTLEYYRSKS
jgi:hypothetical protein